MNSIMLSTGKDDWETPQDLFDRLNRKYQFTLDPCATPQNTKCQKYFTIQDDGLLQNWKGHTVFCNPPYSKRSKDNPGQEAWIQKAYEESRDPNTTVVMLLPARTDTKAFHKYILPYADIEFLPGRVKFVGAKHNAPFPCMIAKFPKSPKEETNG